MSLKKTRVKRPGPVVQRELSADQVWLLSGKWDVEEDVIRNWLNHAANEHLKRSGVDAGEAKRYGDDLVESLRKLFVDGASVDPELYKRVDDGSIQREAPSRLKIIVLGILKWVFVTTEVLVFFWAWYFAGYLNWIVTLVGGGLAFAALIAGKGVGAFWVAYENEDSLSMRRAIGRAILGISLILFLSWFRSGASGVPLTLVNEAAIIAFAIVGARALELILVEKYRYCREVTWQAQRVFAADMHEMAWDKKTWEHVYGKRVDELASGYEDVRRRSSHRLGQSGESV